MSEELTQLDAGASAPTSISSASTARSGRPKDGISALSGVIETDWLLYNFTVNWIFTRPGVAVCATRSAITEIRVKVCRSLGPNQMRSRAADTGPTGRTSRVVIRRANYDTMRSWPGHED